MSDTTNKELLDALGVEVTAETKSALTPRQERIIAGFEDIQRFVEEHGRAPSHGEDKDIFERIYAMRLDQIRRQSECIELLTELDHQDLLDARNEPAALGSDLDDKDILAALGVEVEAKDENDITNLQNVKTRAEIKAAEEVGRHTPCEDFETFKPLFTAVQQEIKTGVRTTRPYKDDATVGEGYFFILSGQLLYIAELGETFIVHGRHKDARLRVIYDNGTESDILMRSLQRALNKDETGRRVTDAIAGPLFTGEPGDEADASGTIYVCRSKSDNEFVVSNRDLVHKIGVTSTSIERRVSNAENDPTFLLAGVTVVATYELYGIDRNKLENLLHRFFASARLKIEIKDRFGRPVIPQEWFCVPFERIEEAIERIKDKSIQSYKYDVKEARLIKVEETL
ncbi:GIY-YIG nuclease family protein [Alphaproteobacteria bacterium]|nr:GIY-YIG nuclease family protein [Alphaproteobacteria bacterium]